MTVTETPPSDQEATPLLLPTPADVVELQAVREYPAVSVLCTTTAGPRMTRGDARRLSALVAEASTRLSAEFGAGPSKPVRDRLLELAGDAAGRPTRSALACYVAPSCSSSWALPVPVSDRTVIDPTFATRDLVRSLHRTPRHVVLVLTDREARLFDGAGDTLLPPAATAFPLSRQQHGARHRGGLSDRRSRAEHDGHLGDADGFLRTVDRALGTYLRVHPAPLVLIGARRTVARFTALSRNTGRLAGCVHGSHARTPLPVLTRLVRPVIEDYLHSRQDEALELLDERTGAGRVVSGMPAVWLAARSERPEMLAVEHGLFYPARLSPDGDLLTPATDVEHPEVIDDAVDEVIETVLHRGGWVALLDDGTLASRDRIALTTRTR
jgi:Bacterial archaeo-eukaryotic release factor family 3